MSRTKRFQGTVLLLAGILVLPAGNADDTDEQDPAVADPAGEAQRCISIRRISRSEVVDSSNIVFYMRDKTIYLNVPPPTCPGLRKRDSIAYRPTVNQLCNVDTVTVVRTGGAGGGRGPSCGLGMFQPVTREQVDSLKAGGTLEADPEAADPEVETGIEAEIETSD